MSASIPAIKFRSLDEARAVLRDVAGKSDLDPFNDGGAEPEGLLAVIPEDRVDEGVFYRLFNQKKGTSVRVEKIPYSGYGPPAEESSYMGFVSENIAYVLEGCRLPIEISNCPNGATDIHHLEALVMDHQHPLNHEDLAERLGLAKDWDFEDLFELITARDVTGEEVDRLIHQGIQ